MFVLQTRSTNTNVDFSLSDSLVQTGNLPKLVFQCNPIPTVGSLGMLKPALPRSSGKKNQRTSSWLDRKSREGCLQRNGGPVEPSLRSTAVCVRGAA